MANLVQVSGRVLRAEKHDRPDRYPPGSNKPARAVYQRSRSHPPIRNLPEISSIIPVSTEELAGLGTIVFGPAFIRRVWEIFVSMLDPVEEDGIGTELGVNAAGMGDARLANPLENPELMAI